MIPWEKLDKAPVPGGGELALARRGQEYSIRVNGVELMNSRAHGSEEALAELAINMISKRKKPRILVGGLGMGFTLAAALKYAGPGAGVEVAELIPAVVRWNREFMGHLAGNPLDDSRVTVLERDLARVIMENQGGYDAILNDVDNGPEGLVREENDWLYDIAGLHMTHVALKSGGVLGVWSVGPDRQFTKRLKQAGFQVKETRARARAEKKGFQHTLWLARKI